MYIDRNGFSTNDVHAMETSDPGFAPISPDTPSWGPPPGSSDPGFAPISPDTPSWGPPPGSSDPGFAPISPDTPSWGPPSGSGSGSGSNSGNNTVVIWPGLRPCFNCSMGSGGSGSSGGNCASVRFLHAAVNQPAVNITLGNRTVINHMQFGSFTPYYRDCSSQNTLVTITNSQTGDILFRRYLNFAGQTSYTVSIINDGSGISLFTLTDSPCRQRNSGCVRVVNLSPNSGPVDVFLSGVGRVFQNVSQLDATDYRTFQRGSYRASVSESLPCASNSSVIIGDTYVECNNTKIAIMDSSTLNIMAGGTYTLYIIGLAYQFPSLQILTIENDVAF
ncbi:MAG: DUF4397 domain-containing protein [Hungatella sp.]|nr:DUF4397 domain-containing protein [Hungatella sp.]